jgi:hypothetical protein
MLAAPQAWSVRSVTAGRQRSPAMSRALWWALATGVAFAGLLLGVASWSGGTGSSGATKSLPPPSAAARTRSSSRLQPTKRPTRPRPKPLAASDGLGAHRVFTGQAFSIAYPRGWTVRAAEASTPWGTDTTVVAPGDPHAMVRVDVVTKPASSDPFTVAQPVIGGVRTEPGYRALRLSNGTFERRPAAMWEFLVAEAGVMVHKEDVFFTSHTGAVIALLTSAPASVYQSLARRFTAIRHSLVAH